MNKIMFKGFLNYVNHFIEMNMNKYSPCMIIKLM